MQESAYHCEYVEWVCSTTNSIARALFDTVENGENGLTKHLTFRCDQRFLESILLAFLKRDNVVKNLKKDILYVRLLVSTGFASIENTELRTILGSLVRGTHTHTHTDTYTLTQSL